MNTEKDTKRKKEREREREREREIADVSPIGFFRAVGKNREWGYRKGREREELGKVPRSTKKKKTARWKTEGQSGKRGDRIEKKRKNDKMGKRVRKRKG